MVTNEERIAVLEANDRNIFHQLDEHKIAIENIQRLVISVEKIADKTNSISDKVDQIDDRLNQVEQQPMKRIQKAREIILTSILSTIGGLLVGILSTILLK